MTTQPEQIDAWRARNWGKPGSCGDCGDPIILADTEDWQAAQSVLRGDWRR